MNVYQYSVKYAVTFYYQFDILHVDALIQDGLQIQVEVLISPCPGGSKSEFVV